MRLRVGRGGRRLGLAGAGVAITLSLIWLMSSEDLGGLPQAAELSSVIQAPETAMQRGVTAPVQTERAGTHGRVAVSVTGEKIGEKIEGWGFYGGAASVVSSSPTPAPRKSEPRRLTTREERSRFVSEVLAIRPPAIYQETLVDQRRKELAEVPFRATPAQRAQATFLVDRLVQAEYQYGVQFNQALMSHVLAGGDVSSSGAKGRRGVGGKMFGAGFAVDYFIEYTLYPSLEHLLNARGAARRELRELLAESRSGGVSAPEGRWPSTNRALWSAK